MEKVVWSLPCWQGIGTIPLQAQMLYEFDIMSTSLPDIRDPNLTPKYLSRSSSLSFDVPCCPKNKRLKGINVTFKYGITGDECAWFCKISMANGVGDLMYNPKVFGKPEIGEMCVWLSYWPIGYKLKIGDIVNVSIVVLSGLEVHECGVSLVYSDEETLENHMECTEILGGDLSRFHLSTGAYYLCRRDFFELAEVGRLTPDWFRILAGDTIDYTEVRGWRKTGRPKQVNLSSIEVKTIRCIIHGPQLEDIYNMAEMSKSSIRDKSVVSTSSLLVGETESGTPSEIIDETKELKSSMGKLVGGALLGDAVSKVSSAIIMVIKKTWHFKAQLKEMNNTIESMRPIFTDVEKLNKELDRRKEETVGFVNLLQQADNLVQKCRHIKLNLWERYSHASKLDALNKSLHTYVQIYLQLQIARDIKETSVVVKDLTKGLQKGSSSGWWSSVPLLKGDVIGFDDRVSDLKDMMFKDSPGDDCSIVVVSAAGGSGKTTFVTLFCHDPDIKGRFGKNIYFVTISRVYDKKVIIKNLLGEVPDNTSDDAAIQQWGSFLAENESEVLLVLDDVWHASVITDFKFKSPRYKILVTSRITFKQFKTYKLASLDTQDAIHLFCQSASPEQSNIPDELVKKLVKCCKFHPLALTVIGGMLKGTHPARWEVMWTKLSGNNSLLDSDQSILECLEKSLYLFDKEPELKQCYLDLGLFPEDQKIAATALMDIWAHLYKHDDEGSATMDILDRLSSINLATLSPKRKRSHTIGNHCVEEFVMQHDVMRDLAIHLNSQKSIEHRETLIINAYGQDLPQLPQTLNARVLSISTDERFALAWNDIQFPKAEVFVFNFMSKMHPLPQFVQHMKRLKVLNITNYGYNFSKIENFPEPQYLSGLTRIRLDHVSISSISKTILMLENLQKLSLIMCKIGESFNQGISNKLTSLLEIDIESCDDLATFPAMLCNLVGLKKLSITNCHELTSLSEEFGNLLSLEVLRLASCSKLLTLPESMRNLKKLRMIDLSHCLNLRNLPLHIGSLQSIDVRGCTELHELPKLVDKVKVVCDEEGSHRWSDLKNVKVEVVEEDALDTFYKIMPKGHDK